MTRVSIGIILVILAQIFCLVETIYFGNNWKAQSPAEAICDNAALLLTFAGLWLALAK
jgi:hypothetical protein